MEQKSKKISRRKRIIFGLAFFLCILVFLAAIVYAPKEPEAISESTDTSYGLISLLALIAAIVFGAMAYSGKKIDFEIPMDFDSE